MQIVEKALKELKKVLFILDFSGKFLNFLLILLFILLLSNLLNFPWIYAVILSTIYLIIVLTLSFFENKFLIVEGKVPELNEQLRTVADNVNRTNPIIDGLKEDVVKNMKKVKTSYFIDEKRIGVKIIILCGLAFLIVFLSFLNINFNFNGFNFNVQETLNGIGIRNYSSEPVHLNFFLSQGNLSDILGNKSIATLGNKDLLLTINPLESDADLSTVQKEESNEFNQPDFPKEIYTRYDASYNEKIAKENQKVVKTYFDQITR